MVAFSQFGGGAKYLVSVPWNHDCDIRRTKFRNRGWKKCQGTGERPVILQNFFSISGYVSMEGLCLNYLEDVSL